MGDRFDIDLQKWKGVDPEGSAQYNTWRMIVKPNADNTFSGSIELTEYAKAGLMAKENRISFRSYHSHGRMGAAAAERAILIWANCCKQVSPTSSAAPMLLSWQEHIETRQQRYGHREEPGQAGLGHLGRVAGRCPVVHE